MTVGNTLPRGMRNNNPLNIEHRESNKWLGLSSIPSDGRFARFTSADYGVRAAALLLMKYYDEGGLNTVSTIVRKWAPATENNVSAYVAAVCKRMSVQPNTVLDLHDYETMRALIAAMARHENGIAVDDTVLNKGMALAGFAAPVQARAVLATPTMFAATTVAVPAVAVGIGAVVNALSDNSEVIGGVVSAVGGPVAGSIALGVITAAAWGWQLYERIRIRQESGV